MKLCKDVLNCNLTSFTQNFVSLRKKIRSHTCKLFRKFMALTFTMKFLFHPNHKFTMDIVIGCIESQHDCISYFTPDNGICLTN